jgi:hypothetical protein
MSINTSNDDKGHNHDEKRFKPLGVEDIDGKEGTRDVDEGLPGPTRLRLPLVIESSL